ncbi:MAG: cysteine hydrolase [Armatimonadota bacterium]|nr:cysteine hydrolase [Armatimonadota bacterium]MDR7487010.1 cysteine hydrolase [Armatimonadota bacterium]MDR7533412.1 cysteine hydrolase [Armatimonadota bacterium]MDR7535220.1 cysteine hydrolase [Armatimonadota bacterium]
MALPPEVESQIDLTHSAVLLIDMQRRHVDPAVGYHLIDPQATADIVAAARRALEVARAHDVPVVHVATSSRRPSPWGFVDHQNPFWAYQTGKIIPGMGRPRQSGKNVEGSIYAEILPELAPQRDEPVVVKRRYSAFYGTDLELVLRGLRTETLFVLGVNTNNCVLATVYDAFSRDLRVVVLADACGSMNGEEYHRAALRQVEAALGFTTTVREFAELVARKRGAEVRA